MSGKSADMRFLNSDFKELLLYGYSTAFEPWGSLYKIDVEIVS
jgi:hypothetical protein